MYLGVRNKILELKFKLNYIVRFDCNKLIKLTKRKSLYIQLKYECNFTHMKICVKEV